MSTGKIIAIVLGLFGGLAVLLIGLFAGIFYVSFKNADATVSPQIDAVFMAIENDGIATTYDSLTTKEFREAVTPKQYDEIGEAISLRLGKLKTKTIRGFNMRHRNAESYVDVTYDAVFEKGKGTITAKLKKQDGSWKFLSFRVNSPVFEQDMATRKCPSCNAAHTANAKFCPSCGTQLSTT